MKEDRGEYEEMSASEAEEAGAFPEDALSEEDAHESVNDDHETPAEALGNQGRALS